MAGGRGGARSLPVLASPRDWMPAASATHTVVPRVTCLSGEFLEKPNEPGPCRQKKWGWDQDPFPGKSCT